MQFPPGAGVCVPSLGRQVLSIQNKVDPLRLELEAIRQSLTLTDLSAARVKDLREALGRVQTKLERSPSHNVAAPAAPLPVLYLPIPEAEKTEAPASGRMRARVVLAGCVATARFTLDLLLRVVFWGFLILFGLQFSHPPKWDSWWWVIELRELGSPLLTGLDRLLEWPQAMFYYPFALAVVVMVGRLVVDSNLRDLQRRLRGGSRLFNSLRQPARSLDH